MKLKGKRLAIFGANNVTEEVTAFARHHGIVLVSVGNVPEAPRHHHHRHADVLLSERDTTNA